MMETGAKAPLYGPYSKKYLGLSKLVPQAAAPGARFDLVVHPTYVNGAVPAPNTTFPCGYHPWQAAPDGSFYSYRCELLPKDRLYASIAFFRLDENAWGVRTRFHNRTKLPQNCMLNYFCALEYPAARLTLPVLPEGTAHWHALDYAQYTYAQPRPWDGLAPDALQKGEFRDEAFTDGHGLGDRVPYAHMPRLAGLRPFGAQAGDAVCYRVAVPALEDAVLTVRYRTAQPQPMPTSEDAVLDTPAEPVVFDTEFGPLAFPSSEELAFVSFPLGAVSAGELALTLTAHGTGGTGVELDFFAVTSRARAQVVGVRVQPLDTRPALEKGVDGQYSLRYAGVDEAFCVRVYGERRRERLLETGSLEDALISRLSNSDPTFDDVLDPFSGSFRRKHSDPGWYQNLLVSGLFLQPGACHTEYAVFSAVPRTDMPKALEQAFRAAKRRAKLPEFNPAGGRYRFSVRCLRAAALTNVVYPLYRRGEMVAHYTPGKRWDSFYTWDSGFIGLGLAQADASLGRRVLEQYLSGPENKDFAFVHHGSLVPVQFYLYQDLLARAQDKAGVLSLYPAMRRYYEFLAGRGDGSATARFASGLLTNYDYFYNASGMDDYAAQVLMHAKGLSGRAAPVLFTAHVIRAAKILRQSARRLGLAQDEARYGADIARLSKALECAWDADCGYFSYVLYGDDGHPEGFLRTDAGENANKGLDGVYPLVAGACTARQQSAALAHLKNPKELFSPVGLTAVDMSAGYYRDDGYWNGAVWFSHQWFFWKTMLDLGEGAFAWDIARTALEAWKREVDDSYDTFEMINIATGRGGWFHQFGGLSCPVYLWACAYFLPGTVSCGFDVWLERASFAQGHTACTLTLCTRDCAQDALVLAVLRPGMRVRALLAGKTLPCAERAPGAWEVTVPCGLENAVVELLPE